MGAGNGAGIVNGRLGGGVGDADVEGHGLFGRDLVEEDADGFGDGEAHGFEGDVGLFLGFFVQPDVEHGGGHG